MILCYFFYHNNHSLTNEYLQNKDNCDIKINNLKLHNNSLKLLEYR